MGLFHVLVWSIEECLGRLRILQFLMVWGATEHSSPGFASCFGPSSFVVCLLSESFYLPVGIGPGGYHHPKFHPQHSCKWAVLVSIHTILVLILLCWVPGVQFYRGFLNSGGDSIIDGWNGPVFSNFTRLLDILLASGQGVLAWLGYPLRVGVVF